MRFQDLGLSTPILEAIAEEGYTEPTPIQSKSVPHVLEGRDLLGCAQTGTGKTAAFTWPILDRLTATHKGGHRAIRCLILAPTRELANQIGDSIRAYGRHLPLRCAVITGGVSQGKQEKDLAHGVDILVACPGRLLDLLGQKVVSLSHVEIFVLDEADRMLDMGFVHDVRRIAKLVPTKRQTLLFSATMPDEIRSLANSLLTDPVEVAVTPVSSTAERIDQVVYFVEKEDKRKLLEWVLDDARIDRAIVFTRTKHGANRVVEYLAKAGIPAAAIHGNKSQNARERALTGLHEGTIRALVATDIAARGIDVEELDCVINFELPNVPETYVHRIGRTGRAGREGRAISFCQADEREYLVDIERLIGKSLPASTSHPYPSPLGLPPPTAPKGAKPQGAKPAGAKPQGARPSNAAPGARPSAPRPASPSGAHRPGPRPPSHPEGMRHASHANAATTAPALGEDAPRKRRRRRRGRGRGQGDSAGAPAA